MAGCTQDIISVKHIYLDSDDLIVTKYENVGDQNYLYESFSHIDLPIEYSLERQGYTVYFRTPALMTGSLYVELKVKNNEASGELYLNSDQIDFYKEDHLWPYIFFIDKHPEDKVFNISILDSDKKQIDVVKINLEPRKLGKIKVYDAI